ncbi:hypothetical protein JCM8208_002168 [Rhodotorula glutinis]
MTDKVGLRLGYKAPNFDAETTQGKINFYDYIGDSWVILFSHFKKRNVKQIGLSCNELGSHEKWVADINKFGSVDLSFPIIADPSRKIAQLYDMLDEQDLTNLDDKGIPFTVRTVFVIDPAKRVRLSLQYPASTGRQFSEILRCIDSLQLTDREKVATPQGWQPGDKLIVHNSLKTEDAKKHFEGKEVEEVFPYLRFVSV